MNKGTLLRGTAVLAVIWAVVWGAMSWSGDRKATPEKVSSMIEEGQFEDWSNQDPSGFADSEKSTRRKRLEELGDVLTKLDLRQYEQVEEEGDVRDLFLRLNPDEQMYFVDLVVKKRTAAFMKALDEMEPEERKQTIDRAMKALTRGDNLNAMDKLLESNPEVIDEIVNKGMRTFYQEASAEIKMELSPLLGAVGKVVQGFEQPGRDGL